MRRRGCKAALGKWYSNWDAGYEGNVCGLGGGGIHAQGDMEGLRA
jgi:hypothetical protein